MARAPARLHAAGDLLAVGQGPVPRVAEPVDRGGAGADPRVLVAVAGSGTSRRTSCGLAYLRTPDLESSLARAAEPVLRHLYDQLDGQPISIVLTDSAGLVLLRLTGDHDLERHLDKIMLAPGFCYAEDMVGTNGIGTALESGGPGPRVRARALRGAAGGHGLRRGPGHATRCPARPSA